MLTRLFEGLGQRTLRRADKGTAATLIALHTTEFLKSGIVVMGSGHRHLLGYQIAWTGFHTAPAPNTWAGLKRCHLILRHSQNRRGCLRNRHIQIKHGKSHHRAAGNHLYRLLLKSIALWHQISMITSQADFHIHRLVKGLPRQCHNPGNQRRLLAHCTVNSDNSRNIIHNTARVRRQFCRINLPACGSGNQCTLTTLRILGL